MASLANLGISFDVNTPVLRLHASKDPNVRWVLWPVLVWRVVAPVPKERRVNVFQRAVLGLARAQVTAVTDVADRLLIAPDLAALITMELRSMAMLDRTGKPTERGLKILEDVGHEPLDEAQVGHVLFDALFGKLWPRFLTGDLPIADTESNDNGWPVLLSGSAGDPWKDTAFSIRPSAQDGIKIIRPSPADVLNAARHHRRQRSYDNIDDERDPPQLQRVSFIDDRPQPYMVALRVRRHDSGDWMVDDPFSRSEAIDLRTRLEERLDKHNGLRPWLASLVGADPNEPTLGQLQIDAAWRVEERLTLNIRSHQGMYERLVAMQRALLEAESPDSPSDKWDDVLVKAQRVVERMLHIIYQEHCIANVSLFDKLAHSDKEYNRCLLDTIAADLGFDAPLPATLSSVRRGKVQHAEQGGSGSLRPLVVLGLLCADLSEEHPFRHAGRTARDLLQRLDELATARDRAAHDGADTRSGNACRHVETTYLAVEALLLQR
jgi:hypothetical protein